MTEGIPPVDVDESSREAVVGIVTMTGVVRHHTAIIDEAHRIETGPSR